MADKGGKKKGGAGGAGGGGKKKKGGGGGSAGAGAGAGAGGAGGDKHIKKETGLAIGVKKEQDFATWYTRTIVCSEMIEYYDVSGCYILRPWAFKIWEGITAFFDHEIKKSGVENVYFPLFVTKKALECEKDHVEGFAAEVAWVTHSGSSELAEPLAIRPTSETVMYPAYAKWIDSHRDLPMRLNQWTNVVRWEFKNPTPFLRTREFLWQEGHSCFRTREEADAEVLEILDLYARVYEEILAVPVIKGRKSEVEKFAGGLYTTTVEAFIPTNGRAIQAATSHCLGQNFSKMFNIQFKDVDSETKLVWQNSWGITTRTIGVMVMVHGDDKGLVMPPRVAPLQVVIVPIYKSKDSKDIVKAVFDQCETIERSLKAAGLRVRYDDRDNVLPGWKYNHWEQKGVPLRIEVGPRDVESRSAMVVRRDNGKKASYPVASMNIDIPALLVGIQADMLNRARAVRDEHTVIVTEWKDFVPTLNGKNLVLAPWCQLISCEEEVKARTKGDAVEETKAEGEEEEEEDGEQGPRGLTGAAKTLCVPMEQSPMPAGQKCFCCDAPATAWCLWGRSY